MTLRDWFAGQALPPFAHTAREPRDFEIIAWRAYQIADAMLAERVKEPST